MAKSIATVTRRSIPSIPPKKSVRHKSDSPAGKGIFDNLKYDELLTAEELAQRLNVALRTIRKWRFTGILPPESMLKLNSQVRYRWREVLWWLKTKEV